jgi:hypothetical protein
MKYVGQALAYAAFAAFVGLLSVWPQFSPLAPQEAIISLSFSHAGQRVGECRQRTQGELDKLPPNMRRPTDCPRERHAIDVSLVLGEELLYQDALPPSGLWSDGKSNVYQRLTVDAGSHRLRISMNDSGTAPAVDYELDAELDISPGQNLLVSFDSQRGEFMLNRGMQ